MGALVERRGRAGTTRIAAGIGLGETEPTDAAPCAEIRQPLLPLDLGSVLVDRVRSEPDPRLDRDRHRLVDATELLERHAERGEVRTASSVLVREGQAEEAEVTHGGDGVDGELVRAIPSLDMRGDLGLGEVADDLPEGLLLIAQLEVHDEARP